MIEVTTRDQAGEIQSVEFDTDAVEVTQSGALIVYTFQARDYIAGFAAGQWLTFQRLDVANG